LVTEVKIKINVKIEAKGKVKDWGRAERVVASLGRQVITVWC
jgi:hypothetical protein